MIFLESFLSLLMGLTLQPDCVDSSHFKFAHQLVASSQPAQQAPYWSTVGRLPGCQPQHSSGQEKLSLTKDEVQAVIDKAFNNLFIIDDRKVTPAWLVADFNGGKVQDIAVLAQLRPNTLTKENAKSFPSFSLYQPITDGGKTNSKNKRQIKRYRTILTLSDLAVSKTDFVPLLIIIHGTPNRLWEASEPQQRFVLLDAMSIGAAKMKVYRGKLKPAPVGDSPKVFPPRLSNDAILFLFSSDKDSEGDILYWGKDGYYWYPFKP